MKLRTLLLGGLALLLAACVNDGRPDPLSTSKGRMAARDAYIQLGLGYLQEGETARAKVPLAKALELDPRSANANAALALVFQAEMEPKLADEHFRRALAASDDSNRARILNNYGSFLYGQGRYDEALQRFSQSADDNMYASRPTVFENLGLTALKLNQADKAEGYFTRALQLDPSLPQSLLELAELARRKQQYAQAQGYYGRFCDLATQNAKSLLLGVRLADRLGDRDRAKSLGLQLKRLYPASPEYQQYLSELP